ncbi:MAG TPA: alpha/beta hydrolase [Candidatus Cryosericum sp.]|nr:alpha/beta hydrolase [Candidatus Cryosericum sp.]
MKVFRRILLTVLVAMLVAVGGFVAWANTAALPSPEALAAMKTTAEAKVSTDGGGRLIFEPVGNATGAGLILYPGARIDPRAYAPVARSIAERGSVVIIVPMVLHLAVLSPDRALEVMTAYPDIRAWAVGGHSLGGAMAAHFVHQYPGKAAGLVLWAAYPGSSDDLSQSPVSVLSVSAARDGLATPEKIAAARTLLPSGTTYVTIQGGNHAQFGSYGTQAGDHAATIAPAEQWNLTAQATAQFLARLVPQS